jgi:exopolysaccharide biosynthesis WecB/TagA/CpsF family protein
MTMDKALHWPEKKDLLGVPISATTYHEAVEAIIAAAKLRRPALVSAYAVHAVVTAARDPELKAKAEEFDIIVPDGQPVRWALNLLYRVGLPSNVRGTTLTWKLCERAAQEGVSVYFYGSAPEVVEKMCANMARRIPGFRLAGSESPPFRPLTAEEDAETVRRINDSGAGIVFIGLGAPKQDHFAFDHRDRIQAVQVCVGAAFDFHAGNKTEAPLWMQRSGLEWLYRLWQEPRRLWKRYLVTNTLFLKMLTQQWVTRCGANRKCQA